MLEFLLKIKNKLKSLNSFENINPHKHWNVLVFLYMIILSILVILSIYFLSQIKNQQIFQTVDIKKESPKSVNEKLLKNITEYFDNKNKEGVFTSYEDPSL